MQESQPSLSLTKRKWTKKKKLILTLEILILLLVFLGVILTMFSSSSVSIKDDVIADLYGLFANAHQYRNRPASIRGGGGAYTGYVLPANVSTAGRIIYTVTVVHADTVVFHAKDGFVTTSTISAKIDSTGQPVLSSWKYTGEFQ